MSEICVPAFTGSLRSLASLPQRRGFLFSTVTPPTDLSGLLHHCNTRYEWLVRPYSTGTFTLQETPSFSWRTTKVLIAAFITHGTCSDLLEHCIRQHEIVTSKFILNELEGHLCRKFKFPDSDVRETMDMLYAVAKVIEPIPLKESVCRDQDDDMVLATALTGKSDCIVTGDKDLTDLKTFQDIPILKPAEFTSFEAGRQA